jgi:hypothetical protein
MEVGPNKNQDNLYKALRKTVVSGETFGPAEW